MRARLVAGAVFVGSLALLPGLTGGAAWAQGPADPLPAAPSAVPSAAPSAVPSAPPAAAPAPPPAAPAPAAAPKGAIVVAVGDDAGGAARALAKEVYREASLRPSLDEFTAKLLTGDTATEARATGKLKELGEIRGSIAKAGSDPAARHLLASLGAELSAVVVISVTIDQGKPFARALRTSSAMYEGATLAGQVDTLEYGTKVYSWPGAATTLLALFPGAAPLRPTADPAAPLAPGKLPAKDSAKEGTPFYKSAWFWGTLGGVAAVGVTVFILSKTTSNANTVHIDGTVNP